MTFSLYVTPVHHLSLSRMKSIFSEFGPVADIYIPKDYDTKKRQNFGYVKYEDKHNAASAIESINDEMVDGHIMKVTWANSPQKTSEQMVEQKKIWREEREKTSVPKDQLTPEQLQKHELRRKFKEGPFRNRWFTAVDYPQGIGEQYTPLFQRGLPPVGKRRLFFTWIYVSPEQKAQILKNDMEKTAFLAKKKAETEELEAAKTQLF